ncbi:M48 family metalloprotease [Ramlibacter pallidus]|uniref:M48 family metalloprotease n=1 Tax=Ramlibacter pallidus TaxID=2780087 RepID=A0ABR9S7B5_9BURK|nr:M48 family metalloprotease [Ramlibacter pallidus]MBE7369380.1 M48 family metalloprotease [Ramlibacter pallidus]
MKPLQRLLAAALLAGLAGTAQAQFGDLLRQLPIPGAGNILNTPAAPGGAAAAGDLLQMLAQSVDNIDEPREIEIGRQLAAVLLGSKPLHSDANLQRYVNRLGRWLSLQSERPHLPWTFGVLDDAGFNAFAAPGGYIFVTKGLVDRVDEAELAGILAHEITHVTARHHLKALAAKARSGIATQLIASQVRSNIVGNAISAQMLALGRDLYTSGLDRADEHDADRQGVTLAARAGFDPYGLPSVLQQLRTAAPDNPLFTLTLSTHPPAQQRLEVLEAAMGNRLDALSGKPSVPIATRLRAR